jgi:uncharacterized protein (TIGR00288 family)
MDDTRNLNIALLIDADNASAATLDSVLTVLAEFGTVTVRRVYGNWSKPALKGWIDMSLKHGIEPQQQFDVTKGKNATDMKMTIDAMDLLYGGNLQGFGIMSSDSDFMPLATRIRQQGMVVYGLGTAKTPPGFQNACTRFIFTDAADAKKPLVVEVPLAESLPPASGRPAKVATPASHGPVSVDDDLVKLLVDSYDVVKHDARGFANLGRVGQMVANRSSFDARNYGFKRLSDLVEAIPALETERREDGQLWIRPLR